MNGTRAATAATWMLGGLVGLCIAAMLGLLFFTLGSGLASLRPGTIERITLADGSSRLAEVVADDGHALLLRTSETRRLGEGYERVRRGDVVARSEPVDAFMIGLGDGRRVLGVGDDAALAAAVGSIGALARVVEVLRPNALGAFEGAGIFLRRLARFVATPPDASNLAGGVLPALVGTVTLVLLMSVLVMPFGVAAAVYLHERRGVGARIVRTAIDTLAGVPAIVYGVLGLGLFVHGIGAGIDRWFYADRLPVPTFGGGGLLWAALTLALLTLPVVVVSVEQGLARIPSSLRDGSLALGATREETLRRLLLPAARPAVLTGFVLAIARAAGSVAPLMLVGMVKLAPASPLDGAFPYLHPSRQFMHLGFAVYDAALASPDAIRGVPRAYACAMLLVCVVIVLNLSAILLRNRLRDRYRALES
ncbi:phosphate ABC transporter permease subunit PstA [Dokdonella fugitiva]|uniref:Phosphate ABC transporter permease subunit PstA n=1 Tax=Dokdonella fugitiva TaxID=328517 RepID=A0A839EQM4_9GAMM|nr:ABC transporter permease subunit [Dokdonella fugitiva]MBA8886045.1 phosphate ABC transporter permease subunit PstA [Dokdonella fugitiva]